MQGWCGLDKVQISQKQQSMKKIVFILTAIIMCTHISAQEGRIPSKGYALFSKDIGNDCGML